MPTDRLSLKRRSHAQTKIKPSKRSKDIFSNNKTASCKHSKVRYARRHSKIKKGLAGSISPGSKNTHEVFRPSVMLHTQIRRSTAVPALLSCITNLQIYSKLSIQLRQMFILPQKKRIRVSSTLRTPLQSVYTQLILNTHLRRET